MPGIIELQTSQTISALSGVRTRQPKTSNFSTSATESFFPAVMYLAAVWKCGNRSTLLISCHHNLWQEHAGLHRSTPSRDPPHTSSQDPSLSLEPTPLMSTLTTPSSPTLSPWRCHSQPCDPASSPTRQHHDQEEEIHRPRLQFWLYQRPRLVELHTTISDQKHRKTCSVWLWILCACGILIELMLPSILRILIKVIDCVEHCFIKNQYIDPICSSYAWVLALVLLWWEWEKWKSWVKAITYLTYC